MAKAPVAAFLANQEGKSPRSNNALAKHIPIANRNQSGMCECVPFVAYMFEIT